MTLSSEATPCPLWGAPGLRDSGGARGQLPVPGGLRRPVRPQTSLEGLRDRPLSCPCLGRQPSPRPRLAWGTQGALCLRGGRGGGFVWATDLVSTLRLSRESSVENCFLLLLRPRKRCSHRCDHRSLLGSPTLFPSPQSQSPRASLSSPGLPRLPRAHTGCYGQKDDGEYPEDVGRQPVGCYGGLWEQLTVPPRGKLSHHGAQQLDSWVRAQDQQNGPTQKCVHAHSRQHCPRPPRRGKDPAAMAGGADKQKAVPPRGMASATAGTRS